MNRIDDKALAKLLRLGQADVLANALNEHFPDLLPRKDGALVYRWLTEARALADQNGLEAFPDQMALAVAICSTNGELLRNEDFVVWLCQPNWADGTFSDALSDFVALHSMHETSTQHQYSTPPTPDLSTKIQGRRMKTCLSTLALSLCLFLAACGGDETVPVSYTGYNNTGKSIVSIIVNGEGGILHAPAHDGGGQVCCVVIPKRWRPGPESHHQVAGGW